MVISMLRQALNDHMPEQPSQSHAYASELFKDSFHAELRHIPAVHNQSIL